MTKTRSVTGSMLILTCCVFAALAAAPAVADVQKGTGEFGIDLGLMDFDSDLADTGARFALRGGYYFTDVIGLEIQGSYAVASEDATNDPELLSLHGNAVVNFPHKRNLVPYFLVGIGGAKLDFGPTDDTGLSGQVAGGARFYGSKGNFGLRFEGGAQWVDTFDDETLNWHLTLGFTWTVGGPHPHDPAPKTYFNP
jgi:hypothetical protein